MSLATKDIEHNLGRFSLTAVGIGILLMVVMGMAGIYRGLVEDATLLVETIGADLWIVQRGTFGPFAEVSRVPASLADRVAVVPGVRSAREFVYHTIQQRHGGRTVRMGIVGLSWPTDRGGWLPLVAGRPLGANHYEMIADRELALPLGTRIRLGKNTYDVVGTTSGMISSAGDGLAFFTVRDALSIQTDAVGESVRLDRASRAVRIERTDVGWTQPGLVHDGPAALGSPPAATPPPVSAVLVQMRAGSSPAEAAEAIAGWGDVTAYTREAQRQLLLTGNVDRSRRQIGLFRVLLTAISAIIMALILYTLTLDKIHSIALLKLIGAPTRVVVGMILQQALLLGVAGYGIAYLLGQEIFPRFPRRVIVNEQDLVELAAIVVAISVISSFLGIWKALKVDPNVALAG